MKKILKFLLVMLFLFLIVGCGPENPEDPSNEQDPVQYTITFKDENNNTLDSKKWDENSIPKFTYTVEDTEEWDYTFEGWSSSTNGEVLDSLPKATKDATYYAIVSKVKQVYTLTFVTDGGTEIQDVTAEYGTTINEPTAPEKENYRFMGWSATASTVTKVTWPITLKSNTTIYAVWNEKVDIKGYLDNLLNGTQLNPSSFIPETMLPDYAKNHVSQSEVTYDYANGVNVSNIQFGGFGDQWNMILNNINQSETFYSVLTTAEALINSSVALFNNYLDKNMEDTASHQIKEAQYTAQINFENDVLTYIIELNTTINIPLVGSVKPQIYMKANVETNERTVRIQLNEENAILYELTENSYSFAIEYGIEALSRKAMFLIEKEDDKVNGHIYEFITLKGSDAVASSAQFYIDDEYVSVVGNKAKSIVAFKGYINELYSVSNGKLLGFEVREKLTFASIEKQYDTLWFNLDEFSGINSVKAVKNDDGLALTGAKNPHNIYLNGSSDIFKPKYNKVLIADTSRKYDIELRNQYFYGYNNGELVEYKTEVPMLFVQAEDLDDLVDLLSSYSKVQTTFNLNKKHIEKIQNDYATLIDIYIEMKDTITSEDINKLLGDKIALIGNLK